MGGGRRQEPGRAGLRAGGRTADAALLSRRRGELRHRPRCRTPEAVAVAQSSGEVWVADSSNHRLSKFTPSGELLLTVGGFTNPNALAFDSTGKLWVADEEEVKQVGPEGEALGEVTLSGIAHIYDLAAEASGGFYAVRTGSDHNPPYGGGSAGEEGVHRYDSSGTELPEVDVAPHGPGSYFKAIALDSGGDLYVAERPAVGDAAVIRELNASGELASSSAPGRSPVEKARGGSRSTKVPKNLEKYAPRPYMWAFSTATPCRPSRSPPPAR